MGGSESKPVPSVSIEIGDHLIEVSTPNQQQYTFFPNPTGLLQFSVCASNDAHIALTSTTSEKDPMYEIFIGGWNNTKSCIRKNHMEPSVAKARTEKFLCKDEYRSFWIRWENRTIMVGREEEHFPFISWTDNEYIPIFYFGIRTTLNASGSWIIKKPSEKPAQYKSETRRSEKEDRNFPQTSNSNERKDDPIPSCSRYEKEETGSKSNSAEGEPKILNHNIEKEQNNIFIPESCASSSNNNQHFNNATDNVNSQFKQSNKKGGRYHKRGNKKVENQNSSKVDDENNYKESHKIIFLGYDKLLEISKKEPELIIAELQNTNFEQLFDKKLNSGFIYLMVQILSKICTSGFVQNKTIIEELFSKENFQLHLLNHIQKIPSKPAEDYKKYWWRLNQFWNSLLTICNMVINENPELSHFYLRTLVDTCESALITLAQMGRKTVSPPVRSKFVELKRKLHPELVFYNILF